jgi:hypothetical protein
MILRLSSKTVQDGFATKLYFGKREKQQQQQ